MEDLAYWGNPVLSLQAMLRTISFLYPSIPRLTPDGIFDERTLEAVMVFQREFFPPVTGRVDNDTWDAIAILSRQAADCLSDPRCASGFPNRSFSISPGDSSVHLYIIQSMFKALSAVLEDVVDGGVTGLHDRATVRNTRWLQRALGLRETGTIDRRAWDALSRLYTVFVTYAQSPWMTRPEALSGEPGRWSGG